MFGFASVILFLITCLFSYFYLKLHGLFSSFVLSLQFWKLRTVFHYVWVSIVVRCLTVLTTSNMAKCCQRNYGIPICMLILILRYGKNVSYMKYGILQFCGYSYKAVCSFKIFKSVMFTKQIFFYLRSNCLNTLVSGFLYV